MPNVVSWLVLNLYFSHNIYQKNTQFYAHLYKNVLSVTLHLFWCLYIFFYIKHSLKMCMLALLTDCLVIHQYLFVWMCFFFLKNMHTWHTYVGDVGTPKKSLGMVNNNISFNELKKD